MMMMLEAVLGFLLTGHTSPLSRQLKAFDAACSGESTALSYELTNMKFY